MTRPLLAALLLVVAGCGRMQVDPGPAPKDAPAVSGQAAATPRAHRRGFVDDSAADARALDSLARLSAGDSMPELDLDDDGPNWDLDVATFADHPRVQYYLDYFTGEGHDSFQAWLDRMPRYEGFARSRFQAAGLPGDLVYIALIESGWSVQARGAAGETGMWQFMPATARAYGLRVDPWVDERRDPIKSTEAAARHLKDLTDQFGSHFLAAAAYNGGAGRVGRGLLRIAALQQGAGDEATDPASDEMFFELADARLLKPVTKDYVPKLLAAALVAKAPERYGFEVPDSVAPFPLDSVMVQGGTGLDLVAKLADTSLDAIRNLNPNILRGITPPGDPYPVRLPAGDGPAVAAAYAKVPPSKRPAVVTHVVRRGETVSGIAKRYGLSTKTLMSANRVARARSLQIGTTLYIPVNTSTLPASLVREGDPVRRGPLTHIVRRGETLSGIAARYNVSQASIRQANHLPSSGMIRAGQKLSISAGAPARSAKSYVVQPGDTVGEIAERYGVTQSALARANGLGRRMMIRVGQRLKIPG